MKTSRLLKISEDLSLILSIEKLDSVDGHYTFGLKTMDSLRNFNNKLQVTMDSEKTLEFFEVMEKLKCDM